MRSTCSFCGDTDLPDETVILGPGSAVICLDCVESATRIIEERRAAMPDEFLLRGIGQLVTNDPRRPDLLGIIEEAALRVRAGRIDWVGTDAERPRQADAVFDCRGRLVIPAFVDAHAAPLLPTGGTDQLIRDTTRRVGAMMSLGTSTVGMVCRAGDAPLAVMRLGVAHHVGSELPVTVVPIHEMPPDVSGSGLLEGTRRSAVSALFDIATNPDLVDRILRELKRLGQQTRVHGGGASGARLAIESASLCWVADIPPTDALARSLTSADVVVVPEGDTGSWWDSGVVVGLSTMHRAGESRVVSMQWAVGDAVRHEGMTAEAAIWAATRGGAVALDRRERGLIASNGSADLIILDAETPDDVAAQPDVNLIHRLVTAGEITDMTGISKGFA